MNLLPSKLFYVPNKDTYPPFKNGFYLEEYVFNYMRNNNIIYDNKGRLYLPILWTNFQIEGWFNSKKTEMQTILDNYIISNICNKGYFTVVQYDDGPLLKLPSNTIIYGACSGTIPIPLIYQDITNKLDNKYLEWNAKWNTTARTILCSFVGTNTHPIRIEMQNKLSNRSNFMFSYTKGWTSNVDSNKQTNFIETTLQSKFALAPRGYGRSSFRFFEIIKLGAIPIYIWDDIEWLPYMDIENIDYTKFSISINISNIDKLENILLNILATGQYITMLKELENIKNNKIFDLDYLCNYITNNTVNNAVNNAVNNTVI
jgi:hypothetical protein